MVGDDGAADPAGSRRRVVRWRRRVHTGRIGRREGCAGPTTLDRRGAAGRHHGEHRRTPDRPPRHHRRDRTENPHRISGSRRAGRHTAGWHTVRAATESGSPHVDRHPPSVAARGLRPVPRLIRPRLPRGRHPGCRQDDVRADLRSGDARRLGRRRRRRPAPRGRRPHQPSEDPVVARRPPARAPARPRLVARDKASPATSTASSRPTSRSPCRKRPTRCVDCRPTGW